MKKVSIVSAVAVSLLLGVVGIQAEEAKTAMPDSVVKEEVAGLKAAKVKGEVAAKAAVEETESKDAFKAKEAGSSFKKDSEAATKKLNGNKEEVKVLEEVVAKDKSK